MPNAARSIRSLWSRLPWVTITPWGRRSSPRCTGGRRALPASTSGSGARPPPGRSVQRVGGDPPAGRPSAGPASRPRGRPPRPGRRWSAPRAGRASGGDRPQARCDRLRSGAAGRPAPRPPRRRGSRRRPRRSRGPAGRAAARARPAETAPRAPRHGPRPAVELPVGQAAALGLAVGQEGERHLLRPLRGAGAQQPGDRDGAGRRADRRLGHRLPSRRGPATETAAGKFIILNSVGLSINISRRRRDRSEPAIAGKLSQPQIRCRFFQARRQRNRIVTSLLSRPATQAAQRR